MNAFQSAISRVLESENISTVGVSYFRDVYSTKNPKVSTLASIVKRIQSDEWEQACSDIRDRFISGGKEGIRQSKAQLPCFTISGTFDARNNQGWVKPSGLVCVDLDGLSSQQLSEAWEALTNSEWTALAFRSPSGAGIKAAIRVPDLMNADPTAYNAAWKAVDLWVTSLGFDGDPAVKDVSRPCYLAHDPNAHWNPECEPFPVEEWGFSERVDDVPPVAGHNGLRPGDDYSLHGDPSRLLEDEGWTLVRDGENQHWSRPGKDGGTSATFKNGVFYVFSSEAHPFEALTSYSRFAVYTLLRHQGDYCAAAKALRAEGYGSKIEQEDREETPSISALDVRSLVEEQRQYRPPLVNGLLRITETMNLVGAPKTRKSWLAMHLARAVATGGSWLGYSATPGAVLYVDNELHPETWAQRARAIGLDQVEGVHLLSLRGNVRPLSAMKQNIISEARRVDASMIVLDALYRFWESGTSENDNAQVTATYNAIDGLAAETYAAVVLVHHSSKGNQAQKSVTDIGSGAQAMSRAADTHLTLRKHEDPGALCVDVALRSWKPVEPFVVRTVENGGLVRDDELDPTLLEGAHKGTGYAQGVDLEDIKASVPNGEVFSVEMALAGLAKQLRIRISKDKLIGALDNAVCGGQLHTGTARRGKKIYCFEPIPEGASGTVREAVVAFLSDNPDASRGEVAEACECSLRTVSKVKNELKKQECTPRGNT